MSETQGIINELKTITSAIESNTRGINEMIKYLIQIEKRL